jgi:hypothetical protein
MVAREFPAVSKSAVMTGGAYVVLGRMFTWPSRVTCHTRLKPAPGEVVQEMLSVTASEVMVQGEAWEGRKVMDFCPPSRGACRVVS